MTLVDEKTTLERQTDDGQEVYTLKANGSPVGYVVIDSKFANTSCGGLRMAWDVSAAEIAAAARAMTLKYGVYNHDNCDLLTDYPRNHEGNQPPRLA